MDIIIDRDPGDEAELVYCLICCEDRPISKATDFPLGETAEGLFTESCEECDSNQEEQSYDEKLAASLR